MKKLIINLCMNFIKQHTNYSDVKLKEIEYGLASFYISFSKSIIIFGIAIAFNILYEAIIFSIIFNILRAPSFGLHATKSWICLLSSAIIFLFIPYLCINLNLSGIIKRLIGIIGILLMLKNSPADTKKRPIISKKRRNVYKTISVILTIIFSFISILIENNFLSNCFIFAIILQNILISPLTYKIFKLPYNNYIEYLKKHPELAN